MAEKKAIKEPSVVIKPIGRFGGLDSIHVAMGVLILILIALLVVVASTKPAILLTNSTSSLNCAYGAKSGACVQSIHTQAEVKIAAERFIASYSNVNTSLSLLPYITNVSSMAFSYSQQTGKWYVVVPGKNPATNTTFDFTMIINDSSLAVTPLIQTITPSILSNETVVSQGVIKEAGKPECTVTNPLQVYWFMDPYSTGSVASLLQMVSLQKQYPLKISEQLEILFTQSSQNIAATNGVNNTLALGSYLFCASQQPNFPDFASSINKTYTGSYISPTQLAAIAGSSGLNSSELTSCLSSAQTLINRQALLAKYYNISASPSIITDCQYLSIPQTEGDAILYANSSI